MTNEWVDNLKPGDNIFVETIGNYGRANTLLITTVKSVGKQHIVVNIQNRDPKKFRRDNLDEAGRKFGRMYMGDPHDTISEYSVDNIEKYELQKKLATCHKIIRFLSDQKLELLSPSVAEQYYNILIQFEKQEP